MTRSRVLLLGALAAGEMLRLQATIDARGIEVELVDEAAAHETPPTDDRNLVIIGAGYNTLEQFARSEPMRFALEDYPPCADYYDWYGRWEEANLPEPVGCSVSLVRLRAVNECIFYRPHSPKAGNGANRTVRGRVWRLCFQPINGEVIVWPDMNSSALQLSLPDHM